MVLSYRWIFWWQLSLVAKKPNSSYGRNDPLYARLFPNDDKLPWAWFLTWVRRRYMWDLAEVL